MKPVSQMNKAAFEAIIGNLRQIGRKYYASIPVGMLYVDPAYQRIESRSQTKINRLAANWNPHKMDALRVVPHPETCSFSIVDGYGRFSASQLLSEPLTAIESEIILDAPANAEERRRFEARLFVEQTEQLEILKPVQKHKAMCLLGDKGCLALDDICNRYRVKFKYGNGCKAAGVIGSYTDALAAVRSGGKECLEFILEVATEAHYTEVYNGLSSYIITGLAWVYKAHKGEGLEETKKILAEKMRHIEPSKLKKEAQGKYTDWDVRNAIALYLEDALVEKGVQRNLLPAGKRLSVAA